MSLSKERSLRVDFVINGTQKRCLTYLHALEVIFRQPYAKHEYKWIASCLESRDIDGNVTCSQIVPFGFINACRNHSISYRPRFSLTGETANVWNNEDVGPFANSSKLLVIPVMRVQSEHRDHISVKWKSPSCLFGSIVKWKLSIETGENSSFYSVEIPFNCSSVDHALSNEDEGYEYSIKIRNNETECHNGAPLLVNKLELSSCTIYRIKLWPIVNVSNERSLLVGEFKLNETLATDIDYNGNNYSFPLESLIIMYLPLDVQDVSVVDVESRSFNIELTVPKRCAGFNVRQLRVNGKVKNTRYIRISSYYTMLKRITRINHLQLGRNRNGWLYRR